MNTTSRRWYRFSLWTVFVLLTLKCFAAAWVAYQVNWIRQRQAARAMLVIKAEFATTAPGLLWMCGEKDGHNAAAMKVMQDELPGSNFVVLPGAGHLSNMDQPEMFTRNLRKFLKA